MKTYLFTYCLSLLVSVGLTPLVIQWARKRGLVDEPDVRKIHSMPVARVGGLAIFLGTVLAMIVVLCLPTGMGQSFRRHGVEMVVLLVASGCIFAVGLYDDLKTARVRMKLIAQMLGALAVIAYGVTAGVTGLGRWTNENQGNGVTAGLTQVSLPIRNGHADPLYLEVQIPPNGSLESVGHRIALIGRLVDEFGLKGLPNSIARFEKPGQPPLRELTDAPGRDDPLVLKAI